MSVAPLAPSALRRVCDPATFGIESTKQLKGATSEGAQRRAAASLRFGMGIDQAGYNTFVIGSFGLGRRTLVERLLRQAPRASAQASDWCYVNNFADPQRPTALRVPLGRAQSLRQDMEAWVAELQAAIPAAFESDDYRGRLARIDAQLHQFEEQAFQSLATRAANDGVALLRSPSGFSFGPLDGHEVMSPEKFRQLSSEQQNHITQAVARYEAELEETVRQFAQLRRKRFEQVRALNQEVIEFAVAQITQELLDKYAELPDVARYIQAAKADVVTRGDDFRKPHEGMAEMPAFMQRPEPDFKRYRVNVLIGDGEREQVPMVYEDNPTYANLVGRVEHVSQFGTLSTDFTLIRAGALHRSNGGYLLVDAIKLLTQPYAWEGLKRALRARQIQIESLGQVYSLVSTQSLEPEPIPLDVKVVLFGPRMVHMLLESADPEFGALFKVVAEFDEDVPWAEQSSRELAQFVAGVAEHQGVRPLSAAALASVFEHCARMAGDASKLSVHAQSIGELLAEADYWVAQGGVGQGGAGQSGAGQSGAGDGAQIEPQHVQRAIDAQRERTAQIKERLQESILRDIVMVDTAGSVVGQINGLAVYTIGRTMFAQPQRITATTRLGKGELIDIQREVALGGPVHSKGVLTLAAFLASRYARHRPLSLAATLSFEQTYGMVDGDSASLAELCALLSSLSGVPIRQSFAVTGSVNQRGLVQAIGGVNEKIEGFFEICKARGLDGSHAVIIPAANQLHLMLRTEVIEAVRAGKFAVYAVSNVDEALALLTGRAVGEETDEGQFSSGSVNHDVVERLKRFDAAGRPKLPQGRREPNARRRRAS